MQIDTTRFGILDIKEEDIIEFPRGLMGFENMSKFVVFTTEEESLFRWMQSIENPALAFVIIKPDEFYDGYMLNISDDAAADLNITDEKMIEIYAIVVIPEDPTKMTANLQGPIVLNWASKKGRQVISLDPKHKIRHFVLEEMQELAAKKTETGKGA